MQTFRSQLDDDQRAVRTDGETGIHEVAEFFGPDRLKMFGCRHLPLGPPHNGVVVCSPLQAELVRNYRREVTLGRTLAAAGFAVQRFHYRGTGNSDGEIVDATLETMRDDAVEAAGWLARTQGLDRPTFVGTRWGAMVAGAAAARFGVSSPLVLWEPITTGRSYFRELFRAIHITNLKQGLPVPPSREEQVESMRRTGWLDILGYSVTWPLYKSVIDRTLVGEVGDEPRPVLLVQISRQLELRKEYQALVDRWRGQGFPVDTYVAEGADEPWWFTGGRSYGEETALAEQVARVTHDWLADAVGTEEIR